MECPPHADSAPQSDVRPYSCRPRPCVPLSRSSPTHGTSDPRPFFNGEITMKPSIFRAARLTLLASCLIPAAAIAGTTHAPKKPRPFSDIFVKDTYINAGWTVAEPNA